MHNLVLPQEDLREATLELAWRQWTALGLAGASAASESLIDPEALLVSTFTLGRYDARLFDEILDWLAKNHSLLDALRLRPLTNDAGRLYLAETLARCRSSLRAEGFEAEIADLRGWALRGPNLLQTALEEATAKVIQLSSG